MRRVALCSFASIWFLVLSCGTNGTGGCDSVYEYPRTDPQAAPLAKTIRARFSTSSLQKITALASGLIVDSCADATRPEPHACDIVENAPNPTNVVFYIGKPDEPSTFSGLISGEIRSGGEYPFSAEYDDTHQNDTPIEERLYCDDTGGVACLEFITRQFDADPNNDFCRDPAVDPTCTDPATDYCCGAAAPGLCANPTSVTNCDAPRSSASFEVDTFTGNLNMSLVADANGGGIQVIMGCTEADLTNCDPSSYIKGSLDLTLSLEGLGGDSACFVQNSNANSPGFEIRTLRFTMQPRVEVRADGKPYLAMTDADITVEPPEIQILGLSYGASLDDPSCYDESWKTGLFCGGGLTCAQYGNPYLDECTSCSQNLNDAVMSWLFNNYFADSIALQLSKAVVDQLADTALEATGELQLPGFFEIPSGSERSIGYLFGANVDSPFVSGDTNALGLNFEVDSGFTAEHATCVPASQRPAYSPAAAPNPDPLIDGEPYDLAFMIGENMVNNLLYAFYDGGILCIDLPASEVEAMSNGAFVPSVATFGDIATGLRNLAAVDAPVDLAIRPSMWPLVSFGTGDGVGDTRDSHIQFDWQGVGLDVYPLIDDAFIRVGTLDFRIEIGISLESTLEGNAELMLDYVRASDFVESYNEALPPMAANVVAELIGLLLPEITNLDPYPINFGGTFAASPLVPKLQGVQELGTVDKFLGVFMKLCSEADANNAADAICFGAGSGGGSNGTLVAEPNIKLAAQAFNANQRDQISFDIEATDDVYEYAFKVDDFGPYLSFRGTDANGRIILSHPLFALSGEHKLQILTRRVDEPKIWSPPSEFVFNRPFTTNFINREISQDKVANSAENTNISDGDHGCASAPISILNALILLGVLVGRSKRKNIRVV